MDPFEAKIEEELPEREKTLENFFVDYFLYTESCYVYKSKDILILNKHELENFKLTLQELKEFKNKKISIARDKYTTTYISDNGNIVALCGEVIRPKLIKIDQFHFDNYTMREIEIDSILMHYVNDECQFVYSVTTESVQLEKLAITQGLNADGSSHDLSA